MAFTAANGWNNLPNGVFSPTIYSKKAQMAFRKTSVVEDITNNSYFGEIANFGDSVKIIKEPDIAVRSYTRGKQISPQVLEDEDFTLTIDRANEFAFQMEDIEKAHSHVDWMDMASDRAAYKLRDAYDTDILGYMTGYDKSTGSWVARTTAVGTKSDSTADSDELLAVHKLDASDFGNGSSGEGIILGTAGTYDATPIQVLNRMKRFLDLKSVPAEGRWVVVDPVFVEKLMDENSKLVNADYNGGSGGEGLTNGRLSASKIRGFRVYESNNLPFLGTGPGTILTTGTRSSANLGFIVAGHDAAVATASQINKTEKLRSHDTFADIVRGLQLYGRKILRPEALIRAAYAVNA